MIVPKKQLFVDESILGFGAFLLAFIAEGKDANELWEYYKNAYNNKKYKIKFSYDQFLLTLDFLYLIGAIDLDKDGIIRYASH